MQVLDTKPFASKCIYERFDDQVCHDNCHGSHITQYSLHG